MQRLNSRAWMIAAVTLGVCVLALPGRADEPQQAGKTAWAPKLYGFCMNTHDAKKRSIPQQARMLRELGFRGVGYPLWLDGNLEKNLQTLDASGLDVYLLHTLINLKPDAQPYDPRLEEAIRKLKGRPVSVCVLFRGLPPGDPRGLEPAVRILRRLGDLAAECGLRISIYHHTGDWTASLIHTLQVVNKTDHPQVGANFNLCHWLMVDGQRDYRAVLRANAAKIFAVTLNGAKLGSKSWTGGLILPLDDGDFDNRELLATLRQIGYRGPIGLMCYGIPGDAREHLQRSMKVWQTWKTTWTKE